MGWLGTLLTDMLTAFWHGLMSVLGWAWTSTIAFLGAVSSWAMDHLPTGMHDFLVATPWHSWFDYTDAIDYFFPIYGIFSVVLATLALVGGIRFTRYVLAMIPTVTVG